MQLANEGGSAFVSQSLRPFVVAALADQDAKRPALVVVGDDRAARDLAADLRAWLSPRPVRYYPSRGVAYESHLTPPPHLVGLRVAALDALTDTPAGSEQPVVVVSATALSEKVPDPKLRPHGFMLRVGDLHRPRRDRAAARRRRLPARRPGRGPRPVRDPRRPARRLPGDRGARGPRRHVRHRGRGAALVLDLHPAQPGGDRVRRDLARGRARARAPRAGRDRRHGRGPSGHRRAAAGRALPRPARADPRAHAGDRRRRRGRRADAARPLGGRLHGVRRPGRARPLRQPGEDQRGARGARRGAAVEHQRQPADRDPRPGRRLRRAQPARGRVRAREARAQRLHDGRRLAAAGRRRARRVQPRPHQGVAERRHPRAGLHRGQPARRVRRPRPEARGVPRAPADPPQEGVDAADAQGPRPAALVHRPAHGRPHRPRGPRHRPLRRLRHQDRRRRHARLPEPRVPGRRQGLHAGRPAGEDLAATWAPTAARRRSPSSAARAGTRSRRGRAAPRRSWPASC